MADYSCDISTVLSKNAESEKFAALAYAEQSQMIRDPRVSKLLVRLSLKNCITKYFMTPHLPVTTPHDYEKCPE